jgi:hypothetical protein
MNAGLIVALLLAPVAVVAQAPAPDSAAQTGAFVLKVREATARYRDRDQAVRDGYRRIGPDFPGMGEHWISVPLLLQGGIDPARPPILEYAQLNGELTLVGAAFAVLLAAHDTPPTAGLPIDASAWHYHGGTVREESFVTGHAHGHATSDQKPRVAVLHVWAWLDNPDGAFATDNWSLPFARLGLAPPRTAPSAEVAHGLALAAGGEAYYLAVVAGPEMEQLDRERISASLAREAAAIRKALKEHALEEALPRVAERWQALRGEVMGLPE